MTEGSPGRAEAEAVPNSPRAYIASLSDYNHMVLHGAWIDNLGDLEHLQSSVQEMLDASAEAVAEEFAIHDFEGFGDWQPNEYEPLENLSRVAAGIEEHGLAFAAWVDFLGDTADDKVADFEDAYRGHWDSMEAYAENMLDDFGFNPLTIGPDWLAPYIQVDLAGLGRDMAMDLHTAETRGGGVWVFDPQT